MKTASLAILAAICFAGCGCGTQVEIVGGNAPVQLAEPVRAFVYVTDPATGRSVKSANRVEIPAYYVAFPPGLLKLTTQPGAK